MLNEIDLSRTDLNLLVLFDVVMRERHVGRAAEHLSLSPSAVSHGLRRLRELLRDPLFIRTPKGVTPTDRALALDGPIAEVLARARGVLAVAAPFAPRTSTRSFVLAAPDGVAAVLLPPLLARLLRDAPQVDVRVRQLLPRPGETSPDAAWRDAFGELDARTIDVAVVPSHAVPARFATRALFDEDFVIAARAGHAFLKRPSVESFCGARHLVVSSSGDPRGFVDETLAQRGLARRVALTVPSFLIALAMLARTDLVAAVPRRFLALHGATFGLASARSPVPLPRFTLHAVAPKPALRDAGLAWLVDRLAEAGAARADKRRRS